MIYSTIAAVIFVVLLVLFFPGDREYQRIPYDVVFLGDSVYGLCPASAWSEACHAELFYRYRIF